MARALWIGLAITLCAFSAAAESVTIELFPQGALALELSAPDREIAISLRNASATSLGCRLTDVSEWQGDGAWVARGNCYGAFQRQGQMLEGSFKLGAFRQVLIALRVTDIDVDLAVPSTPYSKDTIPRNWESVCNNGVVHHTATIDPHQLPARAIRVVAGYRTAELWMIIGPVPLVLLLAFLLVAWLNQAAAKAQSMDQRALAFAYLHALAWGLAALYLLWAAIWATIAGVYAGETDVWALYSVWNGGSAIAGKALATFLCLSPALLAAVLSMWWAPEAFGWLRDSPSRLLDSLRLFLLPALALIVPASWTLGAFNALGGAQLWRVFSGIWIAVAMALFARWGIRYGRDAKVPRLTSGEVFDRLQSLAVRMRVSLQEIHVVPGRVGALAEPIETEGNCLALSEYVMETMEPAEIEAAVARRWCLPIRRYPDLRRVLIFFGALLAGMLLSLVLLGILGIVFRSVRRVSTPTAFVRMILPEAIFWSALFGRLFHSWLVKRADRRAAALLRDSAPVQRAAEKLALMESAPWKWARIAPPVAAPAADATPSVPQSTTPPSIELALVFSSAFRSTVKNLKAEGMLLAVSLPPVAVALVVRAGLIPESARWPAYLAGMAFAILCRTVVSKTLDCLADRRLHRKLRARMQEVETGGSIFVGLSTAPRAMVYDGAYDWDIGFLTLFSDRLDYHGEQAQFTLRRDQVQAIRIGEGAPHWSDPYWVYLSWCDEASGREGTFPLILPRVRSPWKHRQYVGELQRSLHEWKAGRVARVPGDQQRDWGLPAFPDDGAPVASPLPHMVACIAICCLGMSFVAGFPLASDATLYFALVWSGNVLWDLFGHKVASSPAMDGA